MSLSGEPVSEGLIGCPRWAPKAGSRDVSALSTLPPSGRILQHVNGAWMEQDSRCVKGIGILVFLTGGRTSGQAASEHARCKGFTLVELLVVIAVLAILASILFPVFGRAREQAKRAQDVSNLRQCAHAIFLYRDDNGNRCVPVNSWGFGSPFFGAWYGSGRNQHDMPWPEIVQPYAKSWEVFRCPMDPDANDEALARLPGSGEYVPPGDGARRRWAWAWRSSYGLNFNWLSYPATFDQGTTMKNVLWSSIGTVSKTIMLVGSIGGREPSGRPRGGGSWAVDAPVAPPDLRAWLGGWKCYYPPQNGDPNSPGCRALWNAWGGCYPFFVGGTVFNVVFCDGHAKGQRLSDLLHGVDPFARSILDIEGCKWDTIR